MATTPQETERTDDPFGRLPIDPSGAVEALRNAIIFDELRYAPYNRRPVFPDSAPVRQVFERFCNDLFVGLVSVQGLIELRDLVDGLHYILDDIQAGLLQADMPDYTRFFRDRIPFFVETIIGKDRLDSISAATVSWWAHYYHDQATHKAE